MDGIQPIPTVWLPGRRGWWTLQLVPTFVSLSLILLLFLFDRSIVLTPWYWVVWGLLVFLPLVLVDFLNRFFPLNRRIGVTPYELVIDLFGRTVATPWDGIAGLRHSPWARRARADKSSAPFTRVVLVGNSVLTLRSFGLTPSQSDVLSKLRYEDPLHPTWARMMVAGGR